MEYESKELEMSAEDLIAWNSEPRVQLESLWDTLSIKQQKAHYLIPENMLKRLVKEWMHYSLDLINHCEPDEFNPTSFRNLLPPSPLNDLQKQINLAQQRWGVDPDTYLQALLSLSKIKWYSTERYNIILYALLLPTSTINYKWIMKEHQRLCFQTRPRSIYMTTDNCIPTSIYKNKNNQRYVSRWEKDLYKLGKKNSRAKIEAQKFLNFQNGSSRKQYRMTNGQRTDVTSIPTEMPIVPDSINTSQIIFAPSRELIAFAYQLIRDCQREDTNNDIAMRESMMPSNSLDEMIKIAEIKRLMNYDPHVPQPCKCSSRLTCTCQSLRGPYAAEDKSSDTE